MLDQPTVSIASFKNLWVEFETKDAGLIDVTQADKTIIRMVRGNETDMIFQEPMSALDVSVQAQVLNLMVELQAQLELPDLFISHDMAVVERVGVMYLGRLVEIAPRSEVFESPQHPCTRALKKTVPITVLTQRKSEKDLNFKPIASPNHSLDYLSEAAQYQKVPENHVVLKTNIGYDE